MVAFVLAFSWGLECRRENRDVGIYCRGSEQFEGFLVVTNYIMVLYAPLQKGDVTSISISLQGRSVIVIPCVLELQKFAFAETVTLQSCLCCYSRAGLWLERACPACRRQMCCHGCLL